MRQLFLKPAKVVWLLCLIACMSLSARAQTHHWVPTVICEKCTPRGFVYGDSLHHVMVIGKPDLKGSFRYTENGGATFHEPSYADPFYYVAFVIGYSYSSYIAPSTYYLFLGLSLWVSTDNGDTWAVRGEVGANPDAGHMWDGANGMIVQWGTRAKSLVTTDSGRSFQLTAQWDQPGLGIFFQDSSKLWRINRKVVSFSWDRGETWQGSLPVDSTGQDIVYTYLQQTKDTNRLYLIGGVRGRSDFFVSTDAGMSWKEIHATGGSRILRVAEQTPERLWLMVSRRLAFPPDDVFESRGLSRFSDTLYYTTDGGSTWERDLSFVGDTISELQFHGPNQGFVVSTRDSTVRLWRYVQGPASVEQLDAFDPSSMYIHPNPSSGEIKYYPRLGGECNVRLVDTYGRTVFEDSQRLEHVRETKLAIPDHLPNGLYFLELARGDARAGQRFVLSR